MTTMQAFVEADNVGPYKRNYRAISADGKDVQNVSTFDADYALRWLNAMDKQGYNLYYGLHLRNAEAMRNTKADTAIVMHMWADFDAKDYIDGKDGAYAAAMGFAILPHMLVDTGGGYQAKWNLDKSYSPPDFPRVEGVAKRLAILLGADKNVADVTRVFRVPGSRNMKPKYGSPLPVNIIWQNDETVALEDFEELLPEPEPVPVANEPVILSASEELEQMAEALNAIDPWSLDYTDWVQVLMAIHSATNGTGLDLAIAWGKGEQGEVEHKWRSFGEGKTTVSTIFHHAIAAGWRPAKAEPVPFIWEPSSGPKDDPDAGTTDPEEAVNPLRRGKVNFLPFVQFLSQEIPPMEFLVDDLLVAGSMSMIVAKPKVGKSILAANLALSVGTGKPFLNRRVKKGQVLYLSLDQETAPMMQQLATLYDDFHIPGEDEPLVAVHSQYALGQDLVNDVGMIVQEIRPALLIVDTLQKLVKITDGNNYQEVVHALAPYSELASRTGCHICFIHHAHKGISDGADATMGSVGFTGAVGTVIVMRRDHATNVVTYEAIQRWTAPVEETAIEFDSTSRRASTLGSPDQARRKALRPKIIGYFVTENSVTEAELKSAFPGNDLDINATLRELVAEHRLVRSDKRPYVYSPPPELRAYGTSVKQTPFLEEDHES